MTSSPAPTPTNARPVHIEPPTLTPVERTNFENRGPPRLDPSANYYHPFSTPKRSFPPRAPDLPKAPTTRESSILERIVQEALESSQPQVIAGIEQERVDTSPHTVIQSPQRTPLTVTPNEYITPIMLIVAGAILLRWRRGKR